MIWVEEDGKLKNCGFKNQKHILFNITHMSSLDYNAMKAHYLFIQFAHTIRQLLDFGSSFVELFQGKLKEIKLCDFKSLFPHLSISL